MILFALDRSGHWREYTVPEHDAVCVCSCSLLGRAFVSQTSSLGDNLPPTYFNDRCFPHAHVLGHRPHPRGKAAFREGWLAEAGSAGKEA